MQKTSRGHPHGQKTYQVWIKEKEEEELKKFKKNISQFFDPSFVILDDAFYEKPETPPSLLTHSMIIVEKDEVPEETFLKKCFRLLGGHWVFSPFS